MSWTQPTCTDCWVRDNSQETPEGLSIRTPVRVRQDDWVPEICCLCGRLTSSGIFIRVDPSKVPFPQGDDQ